MLFYNIQPRSSSHLGTRLQAWRGVPVALFRRQQRAIEIFFEKEAFFNTAAVIFECNFAKTLLFTFKRMEVLSDRPP